VSAATGEGPAWRRAATGALEGAGLVCLGLLLNSLVSGRRLSSFLGPHGVAFVLLGAVVFALGRAVGRGWVGACVGALVGIALGYFVGQKIPWKYEYPRPARGEATEVAGPTLDGKQIDLKDYRGKVVLVDFWATWCGPCVRELPNVRNVYDRYHADGLEIIAVSLDQSREQLAGFVKEHKLPWPQIFFDEEGKRYWDNPVAVAHKVRGIPATILVGRDGQVLARDLRGPALEEAVASALEGKVPMETVPAGLYAGLVVGCLLGAAGGALLERRQRQLPPGPQPVVGTPP
jgi:thiol-disulfide isomerase/thioredoxin